MSEVNDMSCCGMNELHHIADDDSPITTIMKVDPDDQGIIIFSDINSSRVGTAHHAYRRNYKSGVALAKMIQKMKLGMVVSLPATVNPNTRNRVKMWGWSLNRTALRKFQAQMKKKFPKKYDDGDELDYYYNPYRY